MPHKIKQHVRTRGFIDQILVEHYEAQQAATKARRLKASCHAKSLSVMIGRLIFTLRFEGGMRCKMIRME